MSSKRVGGRGGKEKYVLSFDFAKSLSDNGFSPGSVNALLVLDARLGFEVEGFGGCDSEPVWWEEADSVGEASRTREMADMAAPP